MFKHLIKLMWNKRRANGLLFLEILLAFVVLFGVLGFCFFNFERYGSPLGFKYENVWNVSVDIPDELDSLGNLQLQDLIKSEVLSLNGVEQTSFIGYVTPFGGSTWVSGGEFNGMDYQAMIFFVDEDYKQLSDLQLIQGRWFTPEDRNAKYEPMVVNKAFMDEFGPENGQLIDSVMTYNGGDRKIIGVTNDFKYKGNFAPNRPLVFLFNGYLNPADDPLENLLVRVNPGTTAELEETIYKRVTQLTKNPDVTIRSLDERRTVVNKRVLIPMVILMVISGFLLINIALGLFGVLFTQINRRRGEIGLRKAMGATPGEVTRQFVFETLIVTVAALTLGTFFAVQVPLLDLLPIDDRFFYMGIVGAILIILLIVVICSLIPSRQAAGLQPASVLHEE